MTAAGKDELLYLLCFAELTWIVECIGQWQRCHQPATPLPGHSYHPPPKRVSRVRCPQTLYPIHQQQA